MTSGGHHGLQAGPGPYGSPHIGGGLHVVGEVPPGVGHGAAASGLLVYSQGHEQGAYWVQTLPHY